MERVAFKRSGYDCKYSPCEHTPKGDHGIHGEEWWYVVKDGDRAVSCFVMTHRFPPTVPSRVLAGEPNRPGSVGFHRAWSESEYDYEVKGCEWIDGGGCYSSTSYCLADEVFALGNADTFEQPEDFWLCLESLLPERTTPYIGAGI